MKCTECGNKTKVIESGAWKGSFHRKRKCMTCGKVFYTSESVDSKARFSLRVARNLILRGELARE
jgi:transcriptional regulator NrdR family protein